MGVAEPLSDDAMQTRDEGRGRIAGLAFCSCFCQERVLNHLTLIEVHKCGVHC